MSVATSDVGQGTGLFQPSRAATIVLAGLLAGAVLATWVSEVALGRSAQLWITYHQAVTPAYTVSLPPLGALTLIAVLATGRCCVGESGTDRRSSRPGFSDCDGELAEDRLEPAA
jgi:hypothetical protein